MPAALNAPELFAYVRPTFAECVSAQSPHQYV